jgi:prolyl-tRNA synthetase
VVVLVVRDGEGVRAAAQTLVDELESRGRRVRLDARTETGFGRRSVDWELKGVPVRVEVGPRELEAGEATVVTRHDRAKVPTPLSSLTGRVEELLGGVTAALRAEAQARMEARTHDVSDLAEAIEAGERGFARIPWKALGAEGETRLGAEGLTVRCLQRPDGSLAVDVPAEEDGEEGDLVAVVARAY